MSRKELEEAFKSFDKDGDGEITAKELVSVMKNIGKQTSLEQAKAMISRVDQDGNGLIDLEEFVQMMGNKLDTLTNKSELQEIFSAFDKDNSGFIDRKELKKTMKQVGLNLTEKDVDQMLKLVGVKNKDKIYFKDFEKLMNEKLSKDEKDNSNNQCVSSHQDPTLNELKVTFSMFDTDNDGKITVGEVHKTLNTLGMSVDLEAAQEMVMQVDLDGNGTICFEEFEQLMKNHYGSTNTLNDASPLELIEVFRIFDKDHDGFLDSCDLKNTMQQLGMDLTEEDIEDMMMISGVNGKNKLSYQDFKKIFNCKEGRLSRFSSMASINSNIKNQDKEGLQAVFSLFDSDGDGSITMDEVVGVLKRMNIQSSPQYVQEIFKQVDLDGNGQIDFDEFVLLTSRYDSPLSDEEEIKEMFKLIDKDRSGSIETNELKEAFISLGVQIDDKDVSSMLKQAGIDGNTIFFDDFVRIMKATQLSSNSTSQSNHQRTSQASAPPSGNSLTIPNQRHHQHLQASSEEDTKTPIESKGASGNGHLPSQSSPADVTWPTKVSKRRRRFSSTTWEAFKLFDQNSDGYISKKELFDTMNTLGMPLTIGDLEEMMRQADINGDGRIDYSEFSKLMTGTFESYAEKAAQIRRTSIFDSPSKKVSDLPGEEELRASFKVFDVNSDGSIDASELRKTLSNLGKNVSPEELNRMLTSADTNRDGRIDYEEFLSVLKTKKN